MQNNKFLEATEISDCTPGCIGVIESSEDWCYKENVKCHGSNNQILRRSADDDGGSGVYLKFCKSVFFNVQDRDQSRKIQLGCWGYPVPEQHPVPGTLSGGL